MRVGSKITEPYCLSHLPFPQKLSLARRFILKYSIQVVKGFPVGNRKLLPGMEDFQ